MFLYFFLLEQSFFHDVMAPSLVKSCRQRSFTPCLELCRFLLAENTAIPQDALIRSVLTGLSFDRVFWHGLIGECLVHGAKDIPRLATAPDSLCCLLAPDILDRSVVPREQYAPIQQVHFGSRDLKIGNGYYRPDHAGLNDREDVRRLAVYLKSVEPAHWTPRDLTPLAHFSDDEQRVEELADVRDWWPSLVELYQNARQRDWVIVCEEV